MTMYKMCIIPWKKLQMNRNKILFCFFILLTSKFWGQNKKEYYLDIDSIQISKIEYESFYHPQIINTKEENDSSIIHRAIFRKKFDVISIDQKKELYNALETLTNSKIDTSKIIILKYFLKDNSCIKNYLNERSYIKSIRDNKNINQYFITEKDYYLNRKIVFEDNINFFKKTFFKYAKPCGNFLVLKPNGELFTNYGEYDNKEVEKIAISNWTEEYKENTTSIDNYVNKFYNGQLTENQQTQLYSILENITSKKINKNVNTFIHFFSEKNNDFNKVVNNKRYWNWVNKNASKINSFIISGNNSNIPTNQSNNLYKDNYGIFKRLFLNKSNYNNYHIIIHKDGSFNVFYGTIDILMILDSIV